MEKKTCCFVKQHSARNVGNTYKTVCGKPATHFKSEKHYCSRHSGTGRYVLRNGDVGDILARFDTEEQLQQNAYLFPDAQLQKITNSHRTTLFRKTS